MQKMIIQNPQKKNFNKPDETKTPPNSSINTIKIGNKTIVKQTFQPGWRWTKDMKHLAKTELCQISHTGVLLSGKLHVAFKDGKELDFLPGDVAFIPPGHDGWVVGDEPAVFISFE